MERKPRHVHEHIQINPFKRSELRRAYEIISSNDRFEVEIETEDFQYTNLEELLTSEAPATEIKMARKDVAVHFQLSQGHVMIHAGPEDLAIGIAAQLKDFFSKYKIRDPPPTMFFLAAGLALGGVLAFFSLRAPDLARKLMVGAMALGVVLVGVIAIVIQVVLKRLDGDQLITFKPEKSGTINWRSAAWDVGRILIAAIVGSVVTLLASRLQKK